MPTYDYRCPQGHEFEAFRKMSDSSTADCPECGEAAEKRMSAGAGLLFKGGRAGGSSSGSRSRGKTLDGGSSGGEPPHAPPDPSRPK